MNEINNNKVNLCDSCSQVYPDCTSKPENVYFGDGIGHDNICACSEYRPSEQPQRMRGKWIEQEDYNLDTYYDCSVCGESWCTIDGTPWDNGMNFCPNCGADMRGE